MRSEFSFIYFCRWRHPALIHSSVETPDSNWQTLPPEPKQLLGLSAQVAVPLQRKKQVRETYGSGIDWAGPSRVTVRCPDMRLSRN